MDATAERAKMAEIEKEAGPIVEPKGNDRMLAEMGRTPQGQELEAQLLDLSVGGFGFQPGNTLLSEGQRFQGKLMPEPALPPAFAQGINFLGQRDSQGAVRLSYQGRF